MLLIFFCVNLGCQYFDFPVFRTVRMAIMYPNNVKFTARSFDQIS